MDIKQLSAMLSGGRLSQNDPRKDAVIQALIGARGNKGSEYEDRRRLEVEQAQPAYRPSEYTMRANAAADADIAATGGFPAFSAIQAPDVPSRGEQRAVGNPADPAMMDAEMDALRQYQNAPQKGLGPQGARLNKQAQSEAPTLADRDAVAALGLNSGETRATGWAARMLQAESVLAQLEGQGTRRGQHMLSWLPGEMIENSLYDDEYRQYRQAAEAFINSALRADTGAQINNDEADRMMRELLPAPGDDDQTVAQKRASRHAFIMSMLTGASEAAPLLPEIGQPVVPIEGGGGATHRFNPETGQIEAIQ
jgi:hypothetical protein